MFIKILFRNVPLNWQRSLRRPLKRWSNKSLIGVIGGGRAVKLMEEAAHEPLLRLADSRTVIAVVRIQV